MTRLKKILSFTLCILMIASIIPLSALRVGAVDVTFDDIVKSAGDVIRPNEGHYSSVNPDDNGAVSVGWIQWHANRALNLLRDIVAKDKAKAKELLGDALYNEITNSATVWTTRVMTKDESAKLSALLDTQNGHDAQDDLAAGDIAAYINHAISLGVKDPSALVYHADIENQCGWGGAKRVLEAAGVIAGGYDKITLDILYEAALADSVAGKYAVRRQKTYNNCLLLEWKEIDTDLEVWDIIGTRNVRKNVETQETESPLVTSLYAGTKVIIFEKAYYPKENSTRARTTMGWITLDPKYTTLNSELSGGTVPAPINFDTNGGESFSALATIKATKRNTPRGIDDLVIYDSEYTGTKTPTNAYGSEAVIDSTGAVISGAAYGKCQSTIPEGGYVLSGLNSMHSWLVSNVKAGYYVHVDVNTLTISVYKDKHAYLAKNASTTLNSEYGTLPIPQKSGYTFCHWQDSSGNTVSIDTVCKTSYCVTLKAVWKVSEGTKITYDKNGGSFEGTSEAQVDGINISRKLDSVVIYRGSATTGTNKHGAEVAVDADDRVVAVYGYGHGNAPIPEGGFVVSVIGETVKWITPDVQVGSIVIFDENNMTVTAYRDDETYNTLNKSVAANSPIGAIPDIKKQYHRFLGWFTALGEKVTPDTIMPAEGLVLTARWEVIPGNIFYDTNGGTLPSLKAKATVAGTNVSRALDTLVIYKDRATTGTNQYGMEVLVGSDGIIDFVHPYGKGNTVIPKGSYVLSGIGTTASWLASNAKVGSYVVVDGSNVYIWESFEAFEASENTSALYGNKIGALYTPKKDGHVFLGWKDASGNIINSETTLSFYGDIHLTASWEKLAAVTFNPSGGYFVSTAAKFTASGVNVARALDTIVIYTGISSTGTNKYGTEIVVSSDGIVTSVNGYGKGNSTVPSGGMVISAIGTCATDILKHVNVGSYISVSGYNISVYENYAALDAEDGTLYIKKGTAPGALANAVMPSKALSGWEFNGIRYNKNTVINEDITLFARWTAVSAELVFNTDGGHFDESTASKKVNGINTARPQDSIIIYNDSYPMNAPATNAYGTEVAVDASGKVLSSPRYGACKTPIPDGGMVISGIGAGYNWIVSNLKAGQYVRFDEETLTLTVWESYSGYLSNEKKTVYTGKEYGPLPTPKKDGYVFCGWKDANGNTVTESTVVTSCDTPVLYAVWAELATVTFDPAGGSLVSTAKKFTAAGVNVPRALDTIVIYTGISSTGTNKYGTEIVVSSDGIVTAINGYGKGNSTVPNGGMVISAIGTCATDILKHVNVGSYIFVSGYSISVYKNYAALDAEDGTLYVKKGTALGALANAAMPSKALSGWVNGEGILYSKDTIINGDVTLFPVWSASSIDLVFNTEGGHFDESTASKKVNGINTARPQDSIIIYNDSYPMNAPATNAYGTEVAVDASGKVLSSPRYGACKTPIPDGGMVISGIGAGYNWIVSNLKAGQYVRFDEETLTLTVWESYSGYLASTKKTVYIGKEYGPLPTPKKDGYVFCGWKNANGNTVTESTVVTSCDTPVLSAVWQEKTILIKYDLNGGSFTGIAKRSADGRNAYRSENATIIYDGDHSKATTGTNAFGAEIVVDTNGTVIEVRPYGMQNATIPSGGFVISGHDTAGNWLIQNISLGNHIVLSGNDFTIYKSKAHYETIHMKSVKYGALLGSLPTAFKAGAAFSGWTLADGTTVTEKTAINYDVTELLLKASWN